MGASAAVAPHVRCRTPSSSAATLRRMFALRGWDDRFHQAVIEELASLVAESHGQRATDRVLAHLRTIGQQPTTHPEIARAVGLPRETVTRALLALRQSGRVRCFALRSERGAADARRVYSIEG